jgi:hypothetical protein
MALVLGATLMGACATAPVTPVPVAGPEAQLGALAGHWIGEYSSTMTGRAGSIVFDLAATADTARGEVWMMGRDRTVPGGGYRPDYGSPYVGVRAVEVLTIHFVRVEDGFLSGVLDPYLDPETGAELVTVFRGRLDGDVITGTFGTTNQATGELTTGLWQVQRKALRAQEEKR